MSGPNYKWTVEFDLLEAAKLYGATIDYLAVLDSSKVPVNDKGDLETIFLKFVKSSSTVAAGNHFSVKEVNQPGSEFPTYQVVYHIFGPDGARLADMYRTIPLVEAQLNEIREQLGGINTTGRSR